MKKKYLFITIIVVSLFLFLSSFCLAQIKEKTFEEAAKKTEKSSKNMKDFLVLFFQNLPEAARRTWQRIISFWKNVFQKAGEAWDKIVIENIKKVFSFFIEEIKKRIFNIGEELEKEREEIR